MRAPTQIIQVRTPRALATGGGKKKKHHRRHGSSGGALTTQRMMEIAIGGALLGFIEKQFPTLPSVPLIGRTGTIALVAYYFGGKKAGLIRDVAVAGAVLSGYELGKEGHITGEIVPQINGRRVGVAAQV